MGDMPIGTCVVCEDQLDHSDAGFCEVCGGAFCWWNCGDWQLGEHRCTTCMDQADEGEDDGA